MPLRLKDTNIAKKNSKFNKYKLVYISDLVPLWQNNIYPLIRIIIDFLIKNIKYGILQLAGSYCQTVK